MKRRFSILTAALALLTFLAVPMGMWGQETVTATSTTMTASVSYQDLETGKLIEYKNSASNSYSNPLRIYSGNTFTIHAKEGVEKITQIAIVANSTSYANATGSATWAATGEGSCSATASVSGSNVTVAITGTATTVTCKPSAQVRWNQLSVTYVTSGTPPAITYTMTYDANGGTGTMTDEDSPYDANATVTVLDNEFTREHFDFVKWNTKADGTGTDYDEGDTFTIRDNTTLYAQWESDGTAGEGSICFSNQSSCTVINGQSVTGEDNLGNTWTITTVGTSSFTSNSGYYQVGSGNSPATSITFTTTLDEEVNVTDFSATFGGFNATRASVVLKVDNTQVGSGTLNGADDVTVSSSSAQIGTTLTVIVTPTAGGVKCYNISYVYETIDNPAVATTTTINVPANFNNDIYQGTTAGTLTATVSAEGTPIGGVTVTWSSSNTGVATIDANGEVTLVAVGTTTITSNYAGVEDEYRPSSATYELTVIDSNAPGSQNNPYTVAQAIAATPSSGTSDNVYIHGIVSRFHNTSIVGDGTNYRYYISDDGTTNTELLVYKGKGLNNVAFSNANDLLIGDEVTICGGLTTYNSTKEVAADNYIVSLVRPAQYTLTKAMTNVAECFVFVGDEEIEFNNNNQAQVRAGVTVSVSLTMEDCYALTSLTVNGSTTGVTEIEPGIYYSFVMPEGDATIGVSATQATQYTLTVVGLNNVTYTEMHAGVDSEEVTLTNNQATLCEGINVDIVGLSANAGLSLQSVTLNDGTTTTTLELEYGVYHFTMPSSDATLTFTTTTAPVYTLATTIESGKTYIIVNQENSRAMGAQNNNNRAAVEVVMDNNKITVSSDDVYEFVIESAGEGVYSIYDARTGGYLYAASGGNYLRTDAELDANGKWAISIDQDGKASIVTQVNNTNKVMQYNNNNKLFSCYGSASQKPVYLFVKDEQTYTLENITGYTGEKDHYFLIASPVTVDPATVAGMTTGDFDLYYFDQAQEDEWRNYEATPFDLVPGTGYLYAKKATTENPTYTFQLTGTPYAGNGTIDLDYDANAEFPGFNLIGNPFGTNANLDLPYYRLNSDGSALNTSTESTQVLVMEGVFVQATSSISTATFSSAAKRVSQLNVKVTRNRSAVLDNAIIRFDNGAVLGKFQLNPNSTKLYITEGNQDYAVVRSNNAGEMPVSFKAAENGNYTLSIEAENVEASYLHLIDNMTGADVDLLATPSYSFDARTTDYENRFRLVFNANGVEENTMSNFAYFNGSSWTVNNMGEATLQVVDMMGRVISTETISGNTEVNLNQAAGVYMLRLVTGNDVKVQKVVVR